MNIQIKKIIREFIPPIFLNWFWRFKNESPYGYFGNYTSWEEAKNDSAGYDSDIILNKVKESLLQVKEGKAVYERDSVLFDHIEYSFPVLAALLRVAVKKQGTLNVLDFGGALGTSYFQSKYFLSVVDNLRWNIVEQKKFVDCGRAYFTDSSLQFFDSIDHCLENTRPNVIFISGSVQYLENPYVFLENLLNYKFSYIIIDRIAFTLNNRDLLTVQKVQPDIYSASYPAWFFAEDKFRRIFSSHYELICDFDSMDEGNIPSKFKGFFYESKENS
jgi:putative methyltransferase (TIGR04325 family)